MVNTDREIEAKFEVSSLDQLDELRGRSMLSSAYRLTPVQEQMVIDTYLDTPDYALVRAGFSLRLRCEPNRRLATVKGLVRTGHDGIHDRYELEVELDREADRQDTSTWPTAIRRRIGKTAGTRAELHPIAVLHQTRHRRQVIPALPSADDDGDVQGPQSSPESPIGELSIDEVTVCAPPLSPDGAPEPVTSFAEVEVELSGESVQEDALLPVARVLAHDYGLRPVQCSKLERAFQAIVDHPVGYPAGVAGIQPHMHMAEAGRLIWRQQLMVILLNEVGARRGVDIEYVHDMRVAIRRARAAAELFAPYFKRKAIRRHLKALRRTASTLGAVRDLDVALKNLRRYGKTRASKERRELNAAAAHWKKQRKAAYRNLLAWLDSPAYGRFIADFARFCSTPGLGVKQLQENAGQAPVPYQVRHILPGTIMERFGAVRSYEVFFGHGRVASERRGGGHSADGDVVSAEILHALRIACKQLRYSLEFTQHILDTAGSELIQQLRIIQDHLGDLNDAAVTKARLEALRQEGLDNSALRHYTERQEQIIQELRESFPEVWQTFIESENRQLLATAIARL